MRGVALALMVMVGCTGSPKAKPEPPVDVVDVARVRALPADASSFAVPQIAGRVNDLADTVEEAALTTFNTWGIGKRKKNNGVLLLIAVAERKARITTGLGVERILTDARASEILHAEVSPRLKQNDFVGAIRGGVRAIESTLTAPR